MEKITELTEAQSKELLPFRDQYWKIGTSTDPIDKEKVKQLIAKAYAEIEAPAPHVIFVASPLSASVLIRTLEADGDDVEKTPVYTYWWGQEDLFWVAFYKFCQHIGVKYDDDAQRKLDLMDEIGKNCGWWYPRKGICVVCERPQVVKMNNQRVLHCENGPAVSFRDGFEVHAWNGTRVPKEWIESPDSITLDMALTWENAEQRRAACEIVGWEKLLTRMGAKLIQKDDDPTVGELYEVDHEAIGGRSKFLRMYCPTGRWFAEPVPPEMQTALEANAWGWGLDAPQYNPASQS